MDRGEKKTENAVQQKAKSSPKWLFLAFPTCHLLSKTDHSKAAYTIIYKYKLDSKTIAKIQVSLKGSREKLGKIGKRDGVTSIMEKSLLHFFLEGREQPNVWGKLGTGSRALVPQQIKLS